MLSDRRVKIIATIGPAIENYESLKTAIETGMNVARLNFSHGEHATHLKTINDIRKLSIELKAPVAILQDLQGPKIRVGEFENDYIELLQGTLVTLSPEFKVGQRTKIPVDFTGLAAACDSGDRILLDDGLIELKVLSVSGEEVEAEVIEGGKLKNRKGLNIPGAQLPVECLTEKDLKDLEFGLRHKVDYVALSFVRQASDIKKLRSIINKNSPSTKIVAKIEMLEALNNLEDIIKLSDAVMVARGDLAVEVGQTVLPGIQKKIIRMCNQIGRPVITATQMLESMVNNPRPTRAEITDIANAVLDGSDALMLSAESASGKFPFKCIKTMSEIIKEVEKNGAFYYTLDLDSEFLSIADAIGASACLTALKLNATAIVCLTTTGKTATTISGYRPKARIIAATQSKATLNKMELIWGIQSIAIDNYENSDEAIENIEKMLMQYGLVCHGDKVILTLGMPVRKKSKTNSLRVLTIGDHGIVDVLDDSDKPLRCRNFLN